MRLDLRGALSEPKAKRPLGELQSAIDLERFWQASLRVLDGVLPHHSCSLMLRILDYKPLDSRHHVRSELAGKCQPVASLSISSPFLASHPRIKLYTYDEVLKEDPRASKRRLEREKYFWGWKHFIHLAFWDGNRPDAVLSIRRSAEQGDFTPEEKESLANLYPMINAGLCRLRALEQERGQSAGMKRFISGLPLPVMFLDDDFKLNFATQEAYDLCALWNYGPRKARTKNSRRTFCVPADIIATCARFATMRDKAAAQDGASAPECKRVKHSSIPRLTAKVDLSQPARGSWARPGFWITFFHEQNRDGADSEPKAEAASLLLLLTPCERRVALLVAEGRPNQDVARRLGKSYRTVELQLTMIYRKLGISCRTELSHLLS